MSITTKKGDTGYTGLRFGKRISKTSLRVEAYGNIDELSAVIGVARAGLGSGFSWMEPLLLKLQSDLLYLGGILAVASEDVLKIPEGDVSIIREGILRLESCNEAMEAKLPRFKEFTYPGVNVVSANLHFARTVARRAERGILRLKESGESLPEGVIAYMNRLSDFLWLFARCAELSMVPDFSFLD